MADVLNHVASNNAHLEFGEEELKMVAIKTIPTGCQIYNTYGQLSNCQLLQVIKRTNLHGKYFIKIKLINIILVGS